MIYLDTHVVAWLYAGYADRFPNQAQALIDTEDLLISPIVELELQYLFEIQKTTRPGAEVVKTLADEMGLARCDLPFDQVIAKSLSNTWTRDPFDRIIAAQAQVRRTSLLTRDETIREHYADAVWFE